MRFGVPRSTTPSPERPTHRSFRNGSSSSRFGLLSDSSDDDSDSEAGGAESDSSDDSDLAFIYDSHAESVEYVEVQLTPSRPRVVQSKPSPHPPRHPQPSSPPRVKRSSDELQVLEDTIASIRLHSRHHDLYEEWEEKTRQDAFRSARQAQHLVSASLHVAQNRARTASLDRLAAQHTRQMQEVQTSLATLRAKQHADEERLKTAWRARDRKLWERIEDVIKLEEGKVRRKLEEQDRVHEEAERKRLEEQRKLREAEEAKKAEEERLENLLIAAMEDKDREEEEKKKRAEQERLEAEHRTRFGLTTAAEDWTHARHFLVRLKQEFMASVKSDKDLKSTWSTIRRQITPKVGQLTHDPTAMRRIAQQIYDIARPATPHPEKLYYAILSSLAKAILLQAETEVTAKKNSAIPLSLVTANLLQRLPSFADVFWVKFVQRTGGWPVPFVVPKDRDANNEPWADAAQRRKAMGYRDGESDSDYLTRITGMMRVYFLIMWAPLEIDEPLPRFYQTSRYWAWFSRVLGLGSELLENAVAAEIIYVALDVGGSLARSAWGTQWVKVLSVVEQGVKVGLTRSEDSAKVIVGGETPEGKAARVRVELEIQDILSS